MKAEDKVRYTDRSVKLCVDASSYSVAGRIGSCRIVEMDEELVNVTWLVGGREGRGKAGEKVARS